MIHWIFTTIILYSFVTFSHGTTLWPMGRDRKLVIVPYEIGSEFNETQTATITAALNDIQNVTCVRFYKRNGQKDYVHFRFSPDLGSSEGVGRLGGMQEIVLSPYGSMNKDRPIHEMLHTLGFHHQHQRYDRDNFVWVYMRNIKPEYRYAFAKLTDRTENQGTSYDYDSILHYYKDAFTVNGKNTIIPVPKYYNKLNTMGHALTLSPGDALRINRLYKCPGYER